MAIAPPSDIVLDVAKAVDPLQYRAAVDKLARLADTNGVEAGTFDDMLGSLEAPAASRAETAAPLLADLRGRLSSPVATRADASDKPYQQFEAFVLQTFIQSMLPKDASHVFGDGLAGSYWSSMLAEQIAGQLAKSGGIGIAAAIKPHVASSAFSALPGYAASLELGFANALLPAADEDGDLTSADET